MTISQTTKNNQIEEIRISMSKLWINIHIGLAILTIATSIFIVSVGVYKDAEPAIYLGCLFLVPALILISNIIFCMQNPLIHLSSKQLSIKLGLLARKKAIELNNIAGLEKNKQVIKITYKNPKGEVKQALIGANVFEKEQIEHLYAVLQQFAED